MSGDSGRQVHERVELLELTGPRDCQQTFDGAFPLVAPRPEHDPEGSLGRIVGGFDARLVHERKEVLIVYEERVGQIAHVRVGGIEMPFSERKEPLFNRQHFRDQFRARQRGTTGIRITTKAMPEPKEAAIERERLPAEAFRRGRGGEVERTEHVAGHVRPAQLALADDIFQIRGQPVTTQDAANVSLNTICNTSEPRDMAMR
jgi:hypothetical protein